MNQTRKIIYIVLGTVFLILGAIGIFLPLLPTTPFWLLTCWFYIRSSERLYERVMSNRYFGSYMKAYMVDKAIPKRAKIVSLSVMWASILFAVFCLIKPLLIKILLILITVGVTVHILSFPTRKE
ncbi:YbaN family protein [Parabacteroides sp. PF5-9]|uniref:YbaN family protein n=1 Tax=Parabacteroides sp. PF5-9 TaxID=1742404 RepID=UPI00247371C7|nr:YbaN family protein [Parabacteroides sp. PF5-9]MDH6358868.1 uncharacterized membrane protein YbaN (DUF454 family) [Parabacteroides sp. PF5-9]